MQSEAEIKGVLLKTLQNFWGYSSFRTPQEEIILSVIRGKDTLALLPTGGGKSLCYQLPALVKRPSNSAEIHRRGSGIPQLRVR